MSKIEVICMCPDVYGDFIEERHVFDSEEEADRVIRQLSFINSCHCEKKKEEHA